MVRMGCVFVLEQLLVENNLLGKAAGSTGCLRVLLVNCVMVMFFYRGLLFITG